jgi:hypothetical protein
MIPALAWRAVAHGARFIRRSTPPVPVSRKRTVAQDLGANRNRLARQLTANANLANLMRPSGHRDA